jgi:hypothetical protein
MLQILSHPRLLVSVRKLWKKGFARSLRRIPFVIISFLFFLSLSSHGSRKEVMHVESFMALDIIKYWNARFPPLRICIITICMCVCAGMCGSVHWWKQQQQRNVSESFKHRVCLIINSTKCRQRERELSVFKVELNRNWSKWCVHAGKSICLSCLKTLHDNIK